MNFKRKKGFTLAEVMIAMTIMIVITMFALTSVFTYVNISKDSTVKIRGVNEISNIFECYKSEDFDSALKFYYKTEELPYVVDNEDSAVLWFYYNKSYQICDKNTASFKAKVTIENNLFTAKFLDKTNAEIYVMEKSYLKGEI